MSIRGWHVSLRYFHVPVRRLHVPIRRLHVPVRRLHMSVWRLHVPLGHHHIPLLRRHMSIRWLHMSFGHIHVSLRCLHVSVFGRLHRHCHRHRSLGRGEARGNLPLGIRRFIPQIRGERMASFERPGPTNMREGLPPIECGWLSPLGRVILGRVLVKSVRGSVTPSSRRVDF